MKNKIVFLCVGIVIGMLVGIVIYNGFQEKTQDMIYNNEKVEMKVSIPKAWTYKTVTPQAASETTEGSPDSGIEIYVNGDSNAKLYFYQQDATISFGEGEGEDFYTNLKLKGKLYKSDTKAQVNHILIFDEWKCAMVYNMDAATYKKYESQILKVLKSISIMN